MSGELWSNSYRDLIVSFLGYYISALRGAAPSNFYMPKNDGVSPKGDPPKNRENLKFTLKFSV